MKLYGLFQHDSFGQWLCAQVISATIHRAMKIFVDEYSLKLKEISVGKFNQKKDFYILELGGMDLEYVKSMKPNKLLECRGVFEIETKVLK